MSKTLRRAITTCTNSLSQLMDRYGIDRVPESHSYKQLFTDEIRLIKIDESLEYSERAFQATYNIMQIMRTMLVRLENTWVFTGSSGINFILEKLTNELANNLSVLMCDEVSPYTHLLNGVFFDRSERQLNSVKAAFSGFNEMISQLANAEGDTRTIDVTNLMSLMKTVMSTMIVPVYDDKTYALSKLLSNFFHGISNDEELLDVFKTPFMSTLYQLSSQFDLNNLHSPLRNMLAMTKTLAYAFDEARENVILPEGTKMSDVIPDRDVLRVIQEERRRLEEIEPPAELSIDDVASVRSDKTLMTIRNQIQFKFLRIQYGLDKLKNLIVADRLLTCKLQNPYFNITRSEKILNLLTKYINSRESLLQIESFLKGESRHLSDELKSAMRDALDAEKIEVARSLRVNPSEVYDINVVKEQVEESTESAQLQINTANELLNIKLGVTYNFDRYFNELYQESDLFEENSYFYATRTRSERDGLDMVNYVVLIGQMNSLIGIVDQNIELAGAKRYSMSQLSTLLPQELYQEVQAASLSEGEGDIVEISKRREQEQESSDKPGLYERVNTFLQEKLNKNIFHLQRYLQDYNEVILAQSFLDWKNENQNLVIKDPSFIMQFLERLSESEEELFSSEEKRVVSEYLTNNQNIELIPDLMRRVRIRLQMLQQRHEQRLGENHTVYHVIDALNQKEARPFLQELYNCQSLVGIDLETQSAIDSIKALNLTRRPRRLARFRQAPERPALCAAKACLPVKWQENIQVVKFDESILRRHRQLAVQAREQLKQRCEQSEEFEYDLSDRTDYTALLRLLSSYWELIYIESILDKKASNKKLVLKHPEKFENYLITSGICDSLTRGKEDSLSDQDKDSLYDYIRTCDTHLGRELNSELRRRISTKKSNIEEILNPSELLKLLQSLSERDDIPESNKKVVDDFLSATRTDVYGDIDIFDETSLQNLFQRDLVSPVKSASLKFSRFFQPEHEMPEDEIVNTSLSQLTAQLTQSLKQLCDRSDVVTHAHYRECGDTVKGTKRVLSAGHNMARLFEQLILNLNWLQKSVAQDGAKLGANEWVHSKTGLRVFSRKGFKIEDVLANMARIGNSMLEQVKGLLNRDGHAYSEKVYQTLIDTDSLVIKDLEEAINSLTDLVSGIRKVIQTDDPSALRDLPIDKLLNSVRVVFELGLVSVDDEEKYQMMLIFYDYFKAVSEIDLEQILPAQNKKSLLPAFAKESVIESAMRLTDVTEDEQAQHGSRWSPIAWWKWFRTGQVKRDFYDGVMSKLDEAGIPHFFTTLFKDLDKTQQYAMHLQKASKFIADGIKGSIPDIVISDEAVRHIEQSRSDLNEIIEGYGGAKITNGILKPRSQSQAQAIMLEPLNVDNKSVRDSLLKLREFNINDISDGKLKRYRKRVCAEKQKLKNMSPLDDKTSSNKREMIEKCESTILAIDAVRKNPNVNTKRQLNTAMKSIARQVPWDSNIFNRTELQQYLNNLDDIASTFQYSISLLSNFRCEQLNIAKLQGVATYVNDCIQDPTITQVEFSIKSLVRLHEFYNYVHGKILNSQASNTESFTEVAQLEELDALINVFGGSNFITRLTEHESYDVNTEGLRFRRDDPLLIDFQRQMNSNSNRSLLESRQQALAEKIKDEHDTIGYHQISNFIKVQSFLNREINENRPKLFKVSWLYTFIKILDMIKEFIIKIINRIFRTRIPSNPLTWERYVDINTQNNIEKLQVASTEYNELLLKKSYNGFDNVRQARQIPDRELAREPAEVERSSSRGQSAANAVTRYIRSWQLRFRRQLDEQVPVSLRQTNMDVAIPAAPVAPSDSSTQQQQPVVEAASDNPQSTQRGSVGHQTEVRAAEEPVVNEGSTEQTAWQDLPQTRRQEPTVARSRHTLFASPRTSDLSESQDPAIAPTVASA